MKSVAAESIPAIGPSTSLPVDSLPGTVDAVLAAVEDHLGAAKLPTATYRVQFNDHCTFREIEAIVPYLFTLGISDLYASPFLQAQPGSSHGYDIVNHAVINPEIGTIDELRSLRSALREHDMGLIADVVPNHMSANPQLNAWWQDVLENGPSSSFASFFDVDWMPLKPDLADKVLLPVLGEQFGKVLDGGQLSVHYTEGTFWLEYYDRRYPIAPRSYLIILSLHLDELRHRLGDGTDDFHELLSILTAIRNLPLRSESNPERLVERRREKEVIKRRLHELVVRSREIAAFVESNIRHINGVPGDPQSFDLLDQLLGEQAYRLAFWRVAADEINYRRFFDINELAAICTEDPQVFTESHRLLFELLDEGTITGMRIDHPDGLYDPQGYLMQLQSRFLLHLCRVVSQRQSTICEGDTNLLGQQLLALWHTSTQSGISPLARPLYVVVEKILAQGEVLPDDWPVHGTVGYEFLNALNGLFVAPEGEQPLSSFYARFSGQSLDFEELAYQDKRQIVRLSMASELNVLGHRLDRISERNRWTRDFTLNSLTHALREVIAGFRVYRSYVLPGSVPERDRTCVEEAVLRAKRRNPAVEVSLFDFVQDVLLLRFHAHADDDKRTAVERFVGKFQQLTGPIMAKAVEDTTFYRFNRLVSLNEVGGEPTRFGIEPAEFHEFNASRLPRLSHSLNTTSTHDTKRSEDVRARINVLSEIPSEWRQRVQIWSRWNRRLKCDCDGIEAPSRNSEYLLYQTLVGTWPGSLATSQARASYVERLQQYMLKVVREAKVHTSWVNPNKQYESSIPQFVAGLLEGPRSQQFRTDMHDFATKVADHGRWNSLSQLVLKVMSPGVADFYQGSELWNLTLVDPDNRRPQDFATMRQTLDDLLDEMAAALDISERHRAADAWLTAESFGPNSTSRRVREFLQSLIDHRDNGQIKLFTTLLALGIRRRFPNLLTGGAYFPLAVEGRFAANVVAFARYDGHQCVIVVAPRLTVRLTGFGGPPPLGSHWEDTVVVLPVIAGDCLQEVFSRQRVPLTKTSDSPNLLLPVSEALRYFNVAMLRSWGSSSIHQGQLN